MEDADGLTEVGDVHRYATGRLKSRVNDPLSDHDKDSLFQLLGRIGRAVRKEHRLPDTLPLDRSLTLGSESQELFFELIRLLGSPVS